MNGEGDDLPESAFYMVGGIDSARAKGMYIQNRICQHLLTGFIRREDSCRTREVVGRWTQRRCVS